MTQASREFQVLVKPIGAICNLDCRYCYYLRKEKLYPEGDSFRMSDGVLENYIVQHLEAAPRPLVSFSWHGGEPTILGRDYFQKIVALQRRHQHAGQRIVNGVQTNGTLIDEDWCRFFAREGFYVGLSMDGPQELHDGYRVTKGQKPTHKQVIRAFRLLQKHKVYCDLLCVVHDQNVHHPRAVYRFFKSIGAKYLQFLPYVELVSGTEGEVTPQTVPAEAFGTFLCAVFDEWVRHDIGRVVIQLFDDAVRPFLGMEHALCIYRETCGNVPVVEHNGDFFSCDHFVYPLYCLGNIQQTPLLEMLESPAQRKFGSAKRETLPAYCQRCEVLSMCNGGCLKDRFIRTPDGEEGLNYLCVGLKRFFTHSRPYLVQFAALCRAGKPADKLMQMIRGPDAKTFTLAGRNDPCPCGSGRKYKRCCLGKLSR
jgi:uncharacterized protein